MGHPSSKKTLTTDSTCLGIEKNRAQKNIVFLIITISRAVASGMSSTAIIGVAGQTQTGYGVAIDSSGNAWLAGRTNGGFDGQSKTGTEDAFLIKFNSAGVKQSTMLMGVASKFTYAADVAIDSNDNIWVTGRTDGNLHGQTAPGVRNAASTAWKPRTSFSPTLASASASSVYTVRHAHPS